LPFEVVSMLLLASMIGCIVIAIKVKMPAHAILPEKEQQEESNTIKVVEEIELEPELEIH
jgi:hypothetical protein